MPLNRVKKVKQIERIKQVCREGDQVNRLEYDAIGHKIERAKEVFPYKEKLS